MDEIHEIIEDMDRTQSAINIARHINLSPEFQAQLDVAQRRLDNSRSLINLEVEAFAFRN
jgi:hypothetical protein